MAAAEKTDVLRNNNYDNYILIDVGANLTNKKYSRDLDSVVLRAKDSGIQKIIVSSISLRGSKEAVRLSRIYPGTLYATAGVHPHDGRSWEEDSSEELKALADCSECVAIGVCGLDYSKNFTPPEVQRAVFRKQLELAAELKKPVLLHERDAHDDLVTILYEFQGKIPAMIIHSFSGSTTQGKNYLDMDMYLAITGFVCKDNSEFGLQEMLTKGILQLDRLLVQSDSPFMYPNILTPKLPSSVKEVLTDRSLAFLQRYCTFQRNEPCSLPATIEIVSALVQKPPEEVALATSFNALKLFGLS